MGDSAGRAAGGPRCIALVGPYLSGKTTLLEAILARCGAVQRQGRIADHNTVGDSSPEARAHAMSVEMNVATPTFIDESFTFIDCPGSIELAEDARNALAAWGDLSIRCKTDLGDGLFFNEGYFYRRARETRGCPC